MSPPSPGPTLCALIEMLRNRPPRTVMLGEHRVTAQLDCDGDRFRLFALYGAVVGVSAVDDRQPQVGELILEAEGIDALVTKIVGVWTSSYGEMLGAGERLYAQVTGDRPRLMIELRARWEGGLSMADTSAVLDGVRPLDRREARVVVDAAAIAGGRIAWRCARA